MHTDLDLGGLPDLPQRAFLEELVRDLWADPKVAALWLGGSLARGEGDAYSDVDLRVAVGPEDFGGGELPASAGRLVGAIAAGVKRSYGDDALLHHVLLTDGQIYDLFVQTTARRPGDEGRLVLGCRDEGFAAWLRGGADPEDRFAPAAPAALERLIISFWLGQIKHLKVAYRGLMLLAWEGEHRMRQDLVRLWYAQATGNDCGPLASLSIHTFSPVEQAAREAAGRDLLTVVGVPMRDAAEIAAAARETQNEMARVGRLLAGRLGFPYPEAAEETARRCWTEYAPPS